MRLCRLALILASLACAAPVWASATFSETSTCSITGIPTDVENGDCYLAQPSTYAYARANGGATVVQQNSPYTLSFDVEASASAAAPDYSDSGNVGSRATVTMNGSYDLFTPGSVRQGYVVVFVPSHGGEETEGGTGSVGFGLVDATGDSVSGYCSRSECINDQNHHALDYGDVEYRTFAITLGDTLTFDYSGAASAGADGSLVQEMVVQMPFFPYSSSKLMV